MLIAAGRPEIVRTPAALLVVLALRGAASAQDLEPRRWTHLPVGTNVVGVAYAYTRGEIFFDPLLEIQDGSVESHLAAASFVHAFDLFGATGRLDVIAPWQHAHWEGLLSGAPASRTKEGFDDPWVRLSVGFAGAPALRGREFVEHQRAHAVRTVVGAALGVRLPLGEYDPERLLNIGQNRFTFVPQLGAVHTRGAWSFELTGSAFLYTKNDDFFGGSTLEQDPLWLLQTHVVHSFANHWWLAGGAGYGHGGASEVNGVTKDDERSNLLVGASVGMPIGTSQGLKLVWLHSDALEDVGSDTDSLVLAWTLRL
jgi:hypothetical protein